MGTDVFKLVNGVLVEMSKEELQRFEESRIQPAEQRRKQVQGEAMRLMRLCDWTMLPDTTTGQARADWMQYRASLRQIMNNPTVDPDVKFPVPPGSFTEV